MIDLGQALMAGVLGALASALLLLAGWGLRAVAARLGRGAAVAAAVALPVGLGAVALQTGLVERGRQLLEERRQEAARAAIVEAAMTPVVEHPEFRRRSEGLSIEETRALAFRLSGAGLARLPDALLVRRLELMEVAVDSLEPSACALLFRGGSAEQAAALTAILERFDEAQLREWMELSARASLASLEGRPATRLDPAEARRAMQALLGSLAPAERARLVRALRDPTRVSDAQGCWGARVLYGTAARLDPAPRAVLARLFAGGVGDTDGSR